MTAACRRGFYGCLEVPMDRDVATATKISWHALSDTEVLVRVQSSSKGLSADEAAARLADYGPNVLPGKPPPGMARIFLRQFLSPLIYILIVAGVVSMAIGEWTDAGFIFAVIVLNVLVGRGIFAGQVMAFIQKADYGMVRPGLLTRMVTGLITRPLCLDLLNT